MRDFRIALAVALLASTSVAFGQSGRTISLTVQESGGIRRTQFPATARVPFPQGALRDPSQIRLLLDQMPVPSQSTAEVRWPDGSIRELVVDFNVSVGPQASLAYTLQYGDGVEAVPVSRGLSVTEEADAVQVGNVRFSKKGTPLLASVKYRDEAIGAGTNGLVVTDTAGVEHDFSAIDGLGFEIQKRGPLVVVLRYSGALRIEGTRVPVVVTAEMPISKSWVKLSAHVEDPARKVRALAFHTPLSLGPLPWVWDVGTGRWTYGSVRNAADTIVLTDSSSGPGRQWTVVAGPKGRGQPYETGQGSSSTFAGWGHLQGTREVVAFAIDRAPQWIGTTRVVFDGEGRAVFELAPERTRAQHDLVVYQHFVSTPVQIGAATSPAAILSPLVVSVK